MAIFSNPPSGFQDSNFWEWLNQIIITANGETDALNERILSFGDAKYPGSNEVTLARTDANGDQYSSLPLRLDADQVLAQKAINLMYTKADKSLVDTLINNLIPGTPRGAYNSVQEMNNAYPGGTTGILVNSSDGFWYYWNGSAWTKGLQYQGTTLSDGSVTNTKLSSLAVNSSNTDYIDYAKIKNSFADLTDIGHWLNDIQKAQYNGQDLLINTNNTITTSSDFAVHLPKNEKIGDLYFNFDYITDSVAADTTSKSNIVDVYLFKSDSSSPQGIGAFYRLTALTHCQVKVPAATLSAWGNDFRIGFVTNDSFNLTITNIFVNYTNKFRSLDEEIHSIENYQIEDGAINDAKIASVSPEKVNENNIDIKNAEYWNADPSSADLIIDNMAATLHRKSGTGTIGILFRANNIVDLSKNVYIRIKGVAIKGWTSIYISNGDATPLLPSIGSFNNNDTQEVYAKLTPDELAQLGANTGIGIIIGGGNFETLSILDIEVSNSSLRKNLNSNLEEINDCSSIPLERSYGQDITNIASANPVSIQGLDLVTPNYQYTGTKGKVSKITVYVSNAGNYDFYIGSIDQYGLLVNETKYELSLKAGFNAFDVSQQDWIIKNGSKLFFAPQDGKLYSADSDHYKYLDMLARDSQHSVNQNGYTGEQIYETEYLIPFNYTVIDDGLSETVDELQGRVAANEEAVKSLPDFSKGLTVNSPNGSLYKLSVDDAGTVIAKLIKKTISKMAIFGNSLTCERGKIGMAASDQYHDWYYHVVSKLKSLNNDLIVNDRTNVAVWETATDSKTRNDIFISGMKPTLSSDTDLVILQLGDNVSSADRLSTFESDAEALINSIKTICPNAMILWVGTWFPTDNIMDLLSQACSKTGAILVDISEYASDNSNRSYIGATRTGIDGTSWQVSISGEASHPGDQGHQLIANAVLKKLGY